MESNVNSLEPATSVEERLQRVREIVRAEASRMTLQVAREFGLPERDVIRCLPPERAIELNAGNREQIIRSLEAIGPVRVLVTNATTTIEVVGRFGGFSELGGFFNVQTPSIDMHIRAHEIDAVFAVEKPSHMDGKMTQSFQFFDRKGNAAFKVFLNFGSAMSPEANELWSTVRKGVTESHSKNG